MNINDLYKLEKKDINRSSEILVKAFYDYPMFTHILGEKHNNENIKIFLKFLVKYAVLFGEAYANSSEIEGIILFTDFENYKFNLVRSIRSGGLSLIKLGQDVGKRFNEFDKFTLKKHKENIKGSHQYVILIGVDPEKQGQGIGSKLLESTLKVAEEKEQSCYLETHGEINVAIYKKYGFEVVYEDVLPGTDIVQYGMKRDKKSYI